MKQCLLSVYMVDGAPIRRTDDAAAAYSRAIGLTTNQAERRFLETRSAMPRAR
jgi:predicted RNA polymerase sigma factor